MVKQEINQVAINSQKVNQSVGKRSIQINLYFVIFFIFIAILVLAYFLFK